MATPVQAEFYHQCHQLSRRNNPPMNLSIRPIRCWLVDFCAKLW
jgi:hypothetical protein